MSFFQTPEAKMAFYKNAYGGLSFNECESAIDAPPPNFQRGPVSMCAGHGRPRIIDGNDVLRADYAKVELRVMSSLKEPSEGDRELFENMAPCINEMMDFAVKKRLGMRPDAIDVDFTVVNEVDNA